MQDENNKMETKTNKPFYKKWWFWVLVVVVIFLYSLGSDTSEIVEETKKEKNVETINEETANEDELSTGTTAVEKEETVLESVKEPTTLSELMNFHAQQGVSTEELYVLDNIVVGQEGDIKPGIYDMEILGGRGNIFGERKDVTSLFINYIGQSKDSADRSYPSKIRLVLFEGDSLELSEISKVKFTAIKDVEPTNELSTGEYIVGRDILPGKYKLSTNLEMDPDFGSLGWDISIYNDNTGQTRDIGLNPSSPDVAIKLEDGEIIRLKFDFFSDGNPDDIRLYFEKME